MANLNGAYVDSTTSYKGLLNLGSSVGTNLSSTLQYMTDGDGNNSALKLSTTGIEIPNSGGASIAAALMSGRPMVGGTATTNVPLLYLNGGTAPTSWDATATNGGTYFGINAVASFAGNFLDLHVNGGSSVFKISSSGAVTSTSSITGTSFVLNGSNFIDVNVGLRLRGQAGGVEISPNGSTVILATASLITLSAPFKYPAGSTGSGAALLGSNSPASTLTAPYTWISAQASDGSVVYIPCWK